ncbi:MAG: hypothetical protein ACYCZO_12635, partial [Daejeonella sp.]
TLNDEVHDWLIRTGNALEHYNTGLQRIVNYLKYKEAIRKSQGTESQTNKLADESKKRWWAENKERFIK